MLPLAPQRPHELLEPGRLGHHKAARLRRRNGEGVWDVSRTIYEGPGRRLDDPASNPKGQFPLDDIEPLIFSVMHVDRWTRTFRSQMLNHRSRPAVVSLLALTIAREPKNQRASPSPCFSAIGFTLGVAGAAIIPPSCEVYREIVCCDTARRDGRRSRIT